MLTISEVQPEVNEHCIERMGGENGQSKVAGG